MTNHDKETKKSAPKVEAPEPRLTLEQKFPKMLYREQEEPSKAIFDMVTVASEEEETKWKAEGFTDKPIPKPKATA